MLRHNNMETYCGNCYVKLTRASLNKMCANHVIVNIVIDKNGIYLKDQTYIHPGVQTMILGVNILRPLV